MAVFEKYINADSRWGIWKMDESVDELLSLFSNPVSMSEQMQHLTAQGRRLEWLSVRALLKELLGEEKKIEYYPSGMPYLADQSFHISISHTRGYVAVILDKNKKVGIDIEQYGERILKLRTKFLSENEIKSLSTEKEVYHLLLLWSAKETIFKILGQQEVEFKEHLQISPFIPLENGSFEGSEFKTNKRHKYLIHYKVHPDFVLTWC